VGSGCSFAVLSKGVVGFEGGYVVGKVDRIFDLVERATGNQHYLFRCGARVPACRIDTLVDVRPWFPAERQETSTRMSMRHAGRRAPHNGHRPLVIDKTGGGPLILNPSFARTPMAGLTVFVARTYWEIFEEQG
jgi:hypothetical protein